MGRRLREAAKPPHWGKVLACDAVSLRAALPTCSLGSVVRIHGEPPILSEVIRLDGEIATLLPLQHSRIIRVGDAAEIIADSFRVPASHHSFGRVLDGRGLPIDGKPLTQGEPTEIERSAPNPLLRRPLNQLLHTGVRSLDAFCSISLGQRMGVFAASGLGKTTLLHQIMRGSKVDVIVLCLVGERGREVGDFVECLRSTERKADKEASPWVVVASTPDQPALVRMRSLFTATVLAESYRDQGMDVLLLVDSLTKFARAARDVGVASGEIPTTRGYPSSVFGYISSLIERTGNGASGSITAFYTLLVEEDSPFDPVAEESRACFDGHIILSRNLADQGIWPPVDITRSVSRPMAQIVEPEHQRAASLVRQAISHRLAKQELIDIGAYRPGSDPLLDSTLASSAALRAFRTQPAEEVTSWAEVLSDLYSISGALFDADKATVPERT